MNRYTADILLIGQGLAGTVLAERLLHYGLTVRIIDRGHRGSATKEAAGVINPVTGRRLVKSWRIDEWLPFAHTYYRQLEQTYGIKLWYDLPVLRLFTDVAMANNWDVRMQHEAYAAYLDHFPPDRRAAWPVRAPYGAGLIRRGARADIAGLIGFFSTRWQEARLLEVDTFRHGDLRLVPRGITYRGARYRKAIFCEGHFATQNPLFTGLPFQPSKGELWLVRIPGMPRHHIVKRKIALVPIGQDLFWAGATNFWDFADDRPSAEGAAWLGDELDKTLTGSYEVVAHRAAIRPTVRHRRPITGFPENLAGTLAGKLNQNRIGIFNGFGTKGTSLIPAFADEMARMLRRDLD